MTKIYILFLTVSLPTLSATPSLKTKLSELWNKEVSATQLLPSRQSYCFKTKSKVFGSALDRRVRPASTSKVFITLWALERLGSSHRFETKFQIRDGKLYIKGGKDPFFVTENLLVVAGKLGASKYLEVIFDKDFYFNWADKPNIVAKNLHTALNSKSWSQDFISMTSNLKSYIEEYSLPFDTPFKLETSRVAFQNIAISQDHPVLTHQSSSLVQQLKNTNMFSNNFYFDHLFKLLGGKRAFAKYLQDRFQIDSTNTSFETGSGLGENYTTCRTALKLMEALKKFSTKHSLNLNQLLSVAGVDQGTLKDRFSSSPNILVAKTGTLRHTSTLMGFIGKTGEDLFGIFNHSWNQQEARALQDRFIEYYLSEGDHEPFSYDRVDYLSILGAKLQ